MSDAADTARTLASAQSLAAGRSESLRIKLLDAAKQEIASIDGQIKRASDPDVRAELMAMRGRLHQLALRLAA